MVRLLAALAAPALMLATPAVAAQPAPAAPAVQPDPGTPAANFTSERIGVTVMGSGPDVVLIPGLSSTPAVWASTMAALPGYRYHLIHVSGFAGRPAGANAEGSYIIPVADEIARYISEAHLDHPAVVGHSMGGSWTILVAARHPELVGKAMVVDMLPYPGIMMRSQGMTDEQMTQMIERIQGVLANSPPEQRRLITSTMVSAMVNTESEKQPQINAALASDQAVSTQGFVDVLRTNLLEDVGRIRAPLVVLYVQPTPQPGGPVITPEQIDRAYQLSYRAAPQAVVTRVPNSAHFVMFDNAPFFQAQLRTFLTTPGTPRPAAPPAQ
jgi:pimeloyl-ACP methyl ester carboxylesterase